MPKEFSRALLAATLTATLPGAMLAQEEPTTPEGMTWHLTAYTAGGVAETVPWVVDAYTDASYYLQNSEIGEYIPWGNQPRTPACRNITDQPF